jgi:chromosomal replication initiation ATPase DnaA
VVEATQVRFDELLGSARTKGSARARFIAMHLFRLSFPDWTLAKIARVMIRKDHSNVLHGIRRAVVLIDSDQPFRAAYDRALSIIYQNTA